MGDAFGPRPCASRRATLRCLALSAAVAIAGCASEPEPRTICINMQTHEAVFRVENGFGWYIAEDKNGFRFIIDNDDQRWRCKEVAQ